MLVQPLPMMFEWSTFDIRYEIMRMTELLKDKIITYPNWGVGIVSSFEILYNELWRKLKQHYKKT